jgi:hypothetical protein
MIHDTLIPARFLATIFHLVCTIMLFLTKVRRDLPRIRTKASNNTNCLCHTQYRRRTYAPVCLWGVVQTQGQRRATRSWTLRKCRKCVLRERTIRDIVHFLKTREIHGHRMTAALALSWVCFAVELGGLMSGATLFKSQVNTLCRCCSIL